MSPSPSHTPSAAKQKGASDSLGGGCWKKGKRRKDGGGVGSNGGGKWTRGARVVSVIMWFNRVFGLHSDKRISLTPENGGRASRCTGDEFLLVIACRNRASSTFQSNDFWASAFLCCGQTTAS